LNVFGFEDRHGSDLVVRPLDFGDSLHCPLNVFANARFCPNGMDAKLGYGDYSSFFQSLHFSRVRSRSILLVLALADQPILPVRSFLAQSVRLLILLGLVNIQLHELDRCLLYDAENFL